jgi:putative SbcD/Mre11-related phosphoesterase
LEPVPDRPILLAGDTLVVADLHIGKEEELRQAGFTLPSQARRMAEEIASVIEDLKPRRLVILGDLKHQFPKSTGLERREVPRFFDAIEGSVAEAHMVVGNHDGNISYILPRWVKLHDAEGFRVEDVGYVHGHAWPSPEVMGARTLLMGHNHPTILFPDRLGFRNIERCWIRAPFAEESARYPRLPEELIILPAYNEFSGGTTMNETGSRLLGPILNPDLVRMEEARVYLLEGVYLGRLRGMMVEGQGQSLE